MANNDNSSKIESGIFVQNAGIVLLNNYIPSLFERLNLIDQNNFKGDQEKLEAVHFLQFLVAGNNRTEESILALNKVLCGIHPSNHIGDGIPISADQIKILELCIEATIANWPAIGVCSLQGFMGNWLVRGGLLTEQADKWELQVEKRAYDLLIERSPFSFSIIKFPWMNKPLHVTWAY